MRRRVALFAFFILVLLIVGIVWLFETVNAPTTEIQLFKGPTGVPYVKGPSGPPPTK